MRISLILVGMLGFLLGTSSLKGQCDSLIYDIDPFDSTYIVAAPHVNIGFTIPSNYQTLEGFKMIEEGKVLFSYTGNDTIGTLFLTLALAERNFHTIESETKEQVLVMLESGRIEGLLNFSDRGTFDSGTNMRIYTHTCALPLDMLYLLSVDPIAKFRVYYDGGYKRTIELTPQQKLQVAASLQCIGEEMGIFPKKP